MMSLSDAFETTGDLMMRHRMKSKRMQKVTKLNVNNVIFFLEVIGAEILSRDGSADSEFGFNMKS